MLHETQRTSAPSATSVSISTAVWIVMCNEPAIRAPFSTCLGPYSSRVAIRPGISVSGSEISLRPNSARPMSLLMYSLALSLITVVFSGLAGMLDVSAEAIAGPPEQGNKDIKIHLCLQDTENKDA